MGSKLDGLGDGIRQGDEEYCVGQVKFEMSAVKLEVSSRMCQHYSHILVGYRVCEATEILFKMNGLGEISLKVRKETRIPKLFLGSSSI